MRQVHNLLATRRVLCDDRAMAVLSAEHEAASVAAELIAVIVAMTGGQPRVLTIDKGRALPSGPFESNERSLQASLRTWVERQTHHPLGYMEQLYTFADPGRTVRPPDHLLRLPSPAAAHRRAAEPRRRLRPADSGLDDGGP